VNPADWHEWTWIALAFAALAVTWLAAALKETPHD
jgi:hypothetical protein